MVKNPICIILYLVLALIAGWTHEEVVPSVLCLVLFFVGYGYYKQHRIYLWQVLGLLFFLLGMCLLLCAPGNFVRINKSVEGYSLLMNIYHIVLAIFDEHFILFPLLLLIPIYIYTYRIQKILNVYVAVLLISFVYVVVAPYLPDRAKLMILSLVVISVGMGIDYLLIIYKTSHV